MPRHKEAHLIDRIGWLRASVLGAKDGIVSTASLIVGVAAAQATPATILLTGIAGLVAGAMSIAALLLLAILGAVGVKVSGAPMRMAVMRVTFWGATAMAATAAIGVLFGTTVA